MSSLLEAFGIDPNDFSWHDIALCRNIDIPDIFFDDYEDDARIAKNADKMCLSCPAIQFCLREGMSNRETGCWGGIYLSKGEIDEYRNSHKEEETWDKLKEVHRDSLFS